MAELKTKETEAKVEDFLNAVSDANVREDCWKIVEVMKNATNAEPKMWGASIVGFGNIHLKYESGREVDLMEIGFSPRKQNITLYLTNGAVLDEKLLANLGKHKTGKGCLYFKRLSDIDEKVLEKLIKDSVKNIRRK